MTAPRWVAWLLIILFALTIVLVLGQRGGAENYGAVSLKQRTFVQHAIHVWFHRQGVESTMSCIARRESGYAPRAYNDDDWPTQSVAGVFQIAYPLWTANNPAAPAGIRHFWHGKYVSWDGFRERLSDPVQSIRLAFVLYRHRGLSPWGGGC